MCQWNRGPSLFREKAQKTKKKRRPKRKKEARNRTEEGQVGEAAPIARIVERRGVLKASGSSR